MQTAKSQQRPAKEQVLASLERILGSEQFADSAQLSRFLRHVVENQLAGETALLKESAIGTAVFRRGPGYDPKADPIVRVEARRLRLRLDSYYQNDGAGDPVRILLPKGGYAPAIEVLEAPSECPPPETFAPANGAAEPPSDSTPPKVANPYIRVWAAGAILLALGLAAFVVYRLGAPGRLPSKFWASILDSDRPALIVPADSGLSMLQDLAHQPATLRKYIGEDYRTQLLSHVDAGETAATFTERRYTPFADLAFAVRLARRPEASRRGILARYARDIRVEDLKRSNLILLGPRHMNPWVELFERDATLWLEHDEATSAYRVRNMAPAAGEIHEAIVTLASVRDEIYGIINYHRNREGAGYILMLAGTSIAGTEAAADLILDDAKLIPWLRKAEHGGELKGFDMLLHGSNLAGSAPRAEVIAFHVDQ